MILQSATRISFEVALQQALSADREQFPRMCVFAYLGGGAGYPTDTLLFGATDAAILPENIICAFPADPETLGRLIHVANPADAMVEAQVRDLCYERVIEAIGRATADEKFGTVPATKAGAWDHARNWAAHLAASGYGQDAANRENVGKWFHSRDQAGCFVEAGKVTIPNHHGGKDWTFNFRDLLAERKADITDRTIVPTDVDAAMEYAKERVHDWLNHGYKREDARLPRAVVQMEMQADYSISDDFVSVENVFAEKPRKGWVFSFERIKEMLEIEGLDLGVAIVADCRARGLKAPGLGRVTPEVPVLAVSTRMDLPVPGRGAESEVGQGADAQKTYENSLYPIRAVYSLGWDGGAELVAMFAVPVEYGGVFNSDSRAANDAAANEYATKLTGEGARCVVVGLESLSDLVKVLDESAVKEAVASGRAEVFEEKDFVVSDVHDRELIRALNADCAVAEYLKNFGRVDAGASWLVSVREKENESSEGIIMYDAVTDTHGQVEAVRQQEGRDLFRVAVNGHQCRSLVAADAREAVTVFARDFDTYFFKTGDTVEIVVSDGKGTELGRCQGWVDGQNNLKAEVQPPDEAVSANQPVRRGRGR